MTTLAIMQPTHIPWAGYFNLIARADRFVFLTDVQFSRGSWQQRNRIAVNGRHHWLTIPVWGAGTPQPISAVRVCDSDWRQRHAATIKQAYARAPHGREIAAMMAHLLDMPSESLSDITIQIIVQLSHAMGIRPKWNTSAICEPGERTARLVAMCHQFEADKYLSPAGSREYIEADGDFAESGIAVEYQQFTPQTYGNWTGGDPLSILEVIAWLGFEGAGRYCRETMEVQ